MIKRRIVKVPRITDERGRSSPDLSTRPGVNATVLEYGPDWVIAECWGSDVTHPNITELLQVVRGETLDSHPNSPTIIGQLSIVDEAMVNLSENTGRISLPGGSTISLPIKRIIFSNKRKRYVVDEG